MLAHSKNKQVGMFTMWRVHNNVSMANFDQFANKLSIPPKKHFSHPVDCVTILLSANRHTCCSTSNRTKRNDTGSQVCTVQFLCNALVSSHKSVYSHRLLFFVVLEKHGAFNGHLACCQVVFSHHYFVIFFLHTHS